MSDRKPLVLGATIAVAGDVTKNRSVRARSAADLERSLGYGAGRLAAGWWVLLLQETLTTADFRLSGLTLRSGGKLGLPSNDPLAESRRRHVSDQILQEHGAAGYAALQRWALSTVTPHGDDRIVKVLPVTPHDPAMGAADQYPMGAGGLQWTLLRPCRFLVAMRVDAAGIAHIPGFATFLGASAPYEGRARLARYLSDA